LIADQLSRGELGKQGVHGPNLGFGELELPADVQVRFLDVARPDGLVIHCLTCRFVINRDNY
jgi:hypothetical protein